MSDSRVQGIPEGLDQPRCDQWPARVRLLLVLTFVAAFAAGAAIFFNLGAQSAQQSAEGDTDVLREELQGTAQSLREAKLALRALQKAKQTDPSGDALSQAIAAQNRLAARLLVDQVLYARHWESLESNDKYKPVIQDLVKRLSKRAYSSRCIPPRATDGPNAPQDEFERDILARFLKERPTEKRPILFAERTVSGQREYAYYQAIYAEKPCLLCHNMSSGVIDLGGAGVTLGGVVTNGPEAKSGPPLKEGDLIAVVQVVIPDPRGSGQ